MKLATGLATLVVAIASTMSFGQANAQQYTTSSNPNARCQPATKAFEADVRKRPLAMVNESATNTFINCAFEIEIQQSVAYGVDIWVSNSSAAPATMTCSGINGYELSGVTEYVSQEIVIPAGMQAATPFSWSDADFDDAAGLISASCNLPQGTAINDTYVAVLQDAPAR